jgi:hypothetical protein
MASQGRWGVVGVVTFATRDRQFAGSEPSAQPGDGRLPRPTVVELATAQGNRTNGEWSPTEEELQKQAITRQVRNIPVRRELPERERQPRGDLAGWRRLLVERSSCRANQVRGCVSQDPATQLAQSVGPPRVSSAASSDSTIRQPPHRAGRRVGPRYPGPGPLRVEVDLCHSLALRPHRSALAWGRSRPHALQVAVLGERPIEALAGDETLTAHGPGRGHVSREDTGTHAISGCSPQAASACQFGRAISSSVSISVRSPPRRTACRAPGPSTAMLRWSCPSFSPPSPGRRFRRRA